LRENNAYFGRRMDITNVIKQITLLPSSHSKIVFRGGLKFKQAHVDSSTGQIRRFLDGQNILLWSGASA
jgi:hypothetical protein